MLTKIKSFVNSTDVPQIYETHPADKPLENCQNIYFFPQCIPVLAKQISGLEKFGDFFYGLCRLVLINKVQT